ncbi:MAG: hypothetical protein AAGF96_19080 [Bacteroidota bacterium]
MNQPLLTLLLGVFPSNAAFSRTTDIQMGFSKRNSAPKDSVYLSGYGGIYSRRYSDPINHLLCCRVTALKNNRKKDKNTYNYAYTNVRVTKINTTLKTKN